MQKQPLMQGVMLMAVIVASLGLVTPQALAQRARVPQTGQTQCWELAGSSIDCDGTGQDGEIQAGVPFPTPRFSAKKGAVKDNLTGLIWLQNADCFSSRPWIQALTDANTLANGRCDLTDSSAPGDWRLPNVKELLSLIDYGHFDPALPAGHPFLNVAITGTTGETGYWSSTTRLSDAVLFDVANPFVVRLQEGTTWLFGLPPAVYRVWPVRGGN